MRQQYQQKPRQRNREDLLASTTYTQVSGSGGALWRKLMINDGDASTYWHDRRIGPGPANPNGPFGGRERSQTITDQQYRTERSEVQKRANAERAKREGFRSVTEMLQSDHRKQQQWQAEEKRRREEEARRERERSAFTSDFNRRFHEEQNRRRNQPGYIYNYQLGRWVGEDGQ